MLIIGIVLAALLIGRGVGDQPRQHTGQETAESAENSETTPARQAPEQAANVTASDKNDGEKPLNASTVSDAAMASLSESLSHGDPRTPPLAISESQQRPDAAILQDHAAYRARQRGAEVDGVMPYAAGILEIPDIERQIHLARVTGSRTPEEIREAEEALDALYEARELLEREHPDIYEQLMAGAKIRPSLPAPAPNPMQASE